MAFELCLNTSTIKPQSLLDKIRFTADAGFRAIELWCNDIYEFIGRGGEARDVERALADHGLNVPCMIAVRGWVEANDLEYPHALDEVRRRFELAARFGSRHIVCTPAREPLAAPPGGDEVALIARRYRDLLELGRQCGVRPLFEYISFFQANYSLPQAWQVAQAADDPDAALVVDAFHSWNSRSTWDDLRRIPAARIRHYHIDDAHPDIPAGRQQDGDRVMVGEGLIDLRGELRLLKEMGYQGAISLELFNPTLWARDPREVLQIGYERLTALVQGL